MCRFWKGKGRRRIATWGPLNPEEGGSGHIRADVAESIDANQCTIEEGRTGACGVRTSLFDDDRSDA